MRLVLQHQQDDGSTGWSREWSLKTPPLRMQPQVTSLQGAHTPVQFSHKQEEMGTLSPLVPASYRGHRQRDVEAHTPISGGVPLSWSGYEVSPAIVLRGIYGVSLYRDGL